MKPIERRHLFISNSSPTKLERSKLDLAWHARLQQIDGVPSMPSEDLTQERRSRCRRAAALAEVCEHVRAPVGADGAGAGGGGRHLDAIVVGGECVPDALLALRAAPVQRNVVALAVRRVLPVAKTAVVAARPRTRAGGVRGDGCSSFLLVPCSHQ